MPVLAHTSDELILDVFGNKEIIKNVEKYALSNNILVYSAGQRLFKRNLLTGETDKLTDLETGIHELKISENGTKFGVILKNSDLLIYSSDKLVVKESNINTFGISDIVLGYETDRDLILQNLETLEIFHKSVFNYQKYFVFKDFCIVNTNKMKTQDEEGFRLIKIDQECTKQIGFFNSLVNMKCKCSPDGNFVLVNASTSYVKNSYFASTILYLYDVSKNVFERVNKLSNILDFNFIDKGFCVVYGNQPSYVTSFNYDFTIKDKYPKGVRNRVYFNRQETHVVFAGFEQLAGNVEAYNVTTKEKFATADELGASKVEWETNGSYYYVSTLKYLKEDNRISKYDYYGRKICSEFFECLSDVAVYGLPQDFEVLKKPTEKFVEKEAVAYVPSILKGNMAFKVTPKVEKPKIKEETEEELLEKIHKIEEYKLKMENNEKLETEELNAILNENKIKKKLQFIKKIKK